MYQAFDILDIPFEKEELINNKSEKKKFFWEKVLTLVKQSVILISVPFERDRKKIVIKKIKKCRKNYWQTKHNLIYY